MTGADSMAGTGPRNPRLLAAVCVVHVALIVVPLLMFGAIGPPVAVLAALSLAAVLGSITTAVFYLCLISAIIPSTLFNEHMRLPGNVHFVEGLYTVIAVLAAAAWVTRSRLTWHRTPLDRPMLVFLGLVVLSCAVGFSYGQSTSQMLRDVRYPLYYGLFYVATGFLETRRRADWVPLLVGAAAIVSLEYLFEFLGVVNLSISGSFIRVARIEGLMLPVGTLLVAAVLLFEHRSHRRILAFLALLPIALSLVLTVGRGMWIGTAAGLGALGVLVLLDRRTGSRWVRMAAIAGVPALVLALGFLFERATNAGVTGAAFQKIKKVRTYEEDHSISGRLVSYGIALKEIQKRPLLGGGHGATVTFPVTKTAIPHILTVGGVDNLYLTLGLRMGLLGVAAFLWLWGSALLLALRAFRANTSSDDRLILAAFITVYSGMLVYGMADATMITNRLAFIHAVFLAIVGRLAAETVPAAGKTAREAA